MQLTLALLGTFQATVEGKPIPESRAKKIEALLIYLAMEADYAHRRESLVGLMFPDQPDEAARVNLRQTLSRLRKVIKDSKADPPFLLVSRETTQFNLKSDIVFDVPQFERAMQGCSQHVPQFSAACAACILQLETGLTLYRGPFLDGFFLEDSVAFDEWALVYRERFQQMAVSGFQTAASFYEHRGEYDQALNFTERMLEIEPWDEAAMRQLLRLMAYMGKRNSALVKYDQFESRLMDELGVEPTSETRSLRQQIIGMATERPYNLPPRDSDLVDRQQDQALIFAQLHNPDTRLISLIGPGGIGKTRLSTEIGWRTAEMRLGPFIDGTFFVPLANINEHNAEASIQNEIVTAMANSMGYTFSGDNPPQSQLLTYLKEKSLLLILDNLEHIMDPCRDLIHQLIQQAPHLKIVVTSRERLNLIQEWVHPIDGLPFPETAEDVEKIEQFGAVQLFIERAQQVNPRFQLAEEGQTQPDSCSRAMAAAICRRLYGMPLAIELAAPWVRLMSCTEILQEISQNYDALSSTLHHISDRHRSIRVVFENSWQLLTDVQQAVLGNLSIFRGGFDRKAAQTVVGADLQTLSTLLDKSLLRRAATAGQDGRFQMQVMLRQYSEEKRQARLQPGKDDPMRQAHSSYYLTFLQTAYPDLISHKQAETINHLSLEMENIRQAWQFAVSSQVVEALLSALDTLTLFYYMRSWFTEGAERFGATVAQLKKEASAAQTAVIIPALQARQGWFTFLLGKQSEGIRLLQASLKTHQKQDDLTPSLYPTTYLAAAYQNIGRLQEAEALAREGVRLSQESNNTYYIAINHNILSQIAYRSGQFEIARHHCQESLQIEQSLGNRWSMGFSLTNLGRFAFAMGEYAEARERYEQSLAIRRDLQDGFGQAACSNYLGDTWLAEGNLSAAQSHFEDALIQFQKIGSQSGMASTLVRLGNLKIMAEEPIQSRAHFEKAVHYAHLGDATPTLLRALLGLAQLGLDTTPTQSVAIAHLVQQHPAAAASAKENAATLLEKAGESASESIDSITLNEAVALFT